MTRPSGEVYLESELQNIRRADVDVLVSLLENEEIKQMTLQDEPQLVTQMGMEFIHYPIPDRSIPAYQDTAIELIQTLVSKLKEGKNVIIHCRKSIGRSPMMAAATMVWLGASPKRAFQHIKKIRRAKVPDQVSQMRWVEEVAQQAPDSNKPPSQSLFGKMFGDNL